jgi:2-keto-4-pentenoate hydratase
MSRHPVGGDDRLQRLADALAGARRSGQALPMAPWLGCLRDADEAYAVQDRVAAALGWFGGTPPRFWKSGGPSRQAVLTHAGLPPAGVQAVAPGQTASLQGQHFHRRGIEAEVALRTRRDVTAGEVAAWAAGTTPPARELVDAMTVSVEVVDTRWAAPAPDAPDVAWLKLADQQSHGALVFGEWRAFDERDWSRQRCELRIGGVQPQSFEGTHPLGDPTWLLPSWLAHATRGGRTVPGGTVVTTGSWSGLGDAVSGDRVEVHFADLGALALQF